MMTKVLRILPALVALIGLFALAAPATAATADNQPMMTYRVAFMPQHFGGGEYDGTLNLHILDSGAISGTFRFDDEGLTHVVSGGRQGDHIWLDLGLGTHYLIDGRIQDGKIVGATQGLGAFHDYTQSYTFLGTPTATHI